MILVVGATGFLGREICRRLVDRGEAVRGLVRKTSDPVTVERLRAAGVETVIGDLRDRASLDAACRDVQAVVTTATTTRSRQPGDTIEATDEAGQLDLVDAARDAGVARYVFVSVSGNISDDGRLIRAKRAVEQRLQQSGMTYTILRPSYFMEFWLGPLVGFDYSNRRATVYGTGERKVSFVSLADVAEFAVRSVLSPNGLGATIEIGGPEAISPLEAVRLFEELAGRPFELQHVPELALEEQLATATDSLQQSFGALMLHYARGDEIPMQETLRRVPVPLTSVRDYARGVLGA
jgi:uncharacterized protein YbjT (DUF2867 family)